MRKSINILFPLILAGCAGKSAPSIAPAEHLPAPAPDREFPISIRLTSQQVTTPAAPIAPEAIYGLWLHDESNVRTWLRIESPRIHLVRIDKDKGIAAVLDGEYTLARDGSIFGVLTTVENFKEKEMVEALYRGEESSLQNFFLITPPEKVQRIQPFHLIPHRASEELALEGDAIFQGRYRKTAETRPTFSRPVPPLGKWQCQIWESKLRSTLHLSDKIDLEILDQITGRRLRLAGEYSVTAGNLLYGLFTSLDQSQGPGRAPHAIPPQLFSFRYAVGDVKRLQIRDLTSTCFDDKARDLLQRDYHRDLDNNQKPEETPRRGARR
jgi:hypothetical protein